MMKQMFNNKSVENFMILGTFTEYLLCTEPYPKHEKKQKTQSLPQGTYHFPIISCGGGGQNTFTWQHIISDIQAVSKIYNHLPQNPFKNKALHNQINNKIMGSLFNRFMFSVWHRDHQKEPNSLSQQGGCHLFQPARKLK